MRMVEVSVGDLVGPALDWVVATIEGLPIRRDPMRFGAVSYTHLTLPTKA